MRSFACYLVIILAFFLQGCVGCFYSNATSGEKVAVVEVKGTIIEPDDVIKQLEEVRKDEDVKAVVVRVDSPGGSVGASQEISRTVKALDKVKPTVISMGDVAASGGYMVALGGRKIFANEGTVTGSIGVRAEHVNAAELFAFFKLKPETFKSGKYKDMGSLYRDMTPEEKALLQGFITELHAQFKEMIVSSRGLTPEFVESVADARVFTGTKAKELGLVDELGGTLEAAKFAAAEAGIKEEPEVYWHGDKDKWWKELLGANITEVIRDVGAAASKFFFYEWKPL